MLGWGSNNSNNNKKRPGKLRLVRFGNKSIMNVMWVNLCWRLN